MRGRTGGKGIREKRGESAIGMKGRRDVSVTGLRGKIDARDRRGRREEKGRSERTDVRGRKVIEQCHLKNIGDCAVRNIAYQESRRGRSKDTILPAPRAWAVLV